MARSDGRHNSHVQESRPASGSRPAVPAEADPAPVPEPGHRGWRVAGLVWAIIFLFLSALLVFDLFSGLLRL